MNWNELEANSNSVKFSHQINENALGGILNRGSWAWLAEDNTLQIVSLKVGQLISSYTFSKRIYNCNLIVCVTELIPKNNSHDVILAVCLDYIPNSAENVDSRSSIAIYSVEYGCVLNWVKLEIYATCMRFLSPKNCHRSLIQHFDGCLAIGTQEGMIITIDLYLDYLIEIYKEKQKQCLNTQTAPMSCFIVDYNLPLVELHRTYKRILRERSIENVRHFGVQIEAIEAQCSIESLLPVDIINGLAAGLEDGRLVIYDMSEMQVIYASEERELGPVLKMDFLEPTDDPRACFYILTVHGNGKCILNCLFSFMYEKRSTDEHGNVFFENFQNGAVKLEMVMESSTTTTITCQAITRPPKNAEDDAICLFAVSWNSLSNGKTKLLVFDINQWYKEEMPNELVGNQAKSCLATFITNANRCCLDSFLNPATISHFNSIQRCEEHFYPNSFSFDWLVIDANSGHTYNWPGIQNKTLNILRASTASLFLEPDIMFEKIRQARLLPQFTELNAKAVFSQSSKYEALLSVALEQNCTGLLRDCIRSWADGSFSGPIIIYSSYYGAELTIQTFKNWIFKRASAIKNRCNELCEELLGGSGHPLDQREKKELGFITRQLKILADLYDEIIQLNTNQELEKDESLRLASEYQELLTWLINIGLLPESSRQFPNDDIPTVSSLASKFVSIYPHNQLRDYYIQRRSEISKVDEGYISKKSGSCRLLFIDAFIEHECMCNSRNSGTHNDNLREHWLQNGGNGLYPPANISSMLRVMLLKNIDYDSKCAIFFYFFFDLHIALTDGERHDGGDLKEIVGNLVKFSNVFKLSHSLTRFLQAFWYLDHGNIVAAVDEFLSPFNKVGKVEQWLIELLVESLLLQNGAHLALRILDAHLNLISPSLQLSILLANNLIGDAFHFVRFKNDSDLMKRFFTNCLKMGKLGVISELALNEHEGKLVENLLRNIQLPGAANLHFIYLLQKSKYIEAVSYLDELTKDKEKEKSMRYVSITNTETEIETETNTNDKIDAPNLVLSAFNTTTAPVTKSLTEIYFRIRDRIKQKETQNRAPVPLSCQLIKQNANNLLGGIYHSSALSAHFASCYYDEELQYGRQLSNNENSRSNIISPLTANNVPFLRKAQTEMRRNAINTFNQPTLSYPQPYQLNEKRRLNELEKEDTVDNGVGGKSVQKQKIQPPSKKRRIQAEDFQSGFKHFQEKNIVLSESGLDLIPQLNKSTLTQPLGTKPTTVESSNQEIENASFTRNLKGNELHSILKSNTPEPSEIKSRRGTTPAIEEKTLRFTLPTELEPIEQQSEPIPEFQVKHRVVTRSISEESSNTQDVEMTQYQSAVSKPAIEIESTTFEELKTNAIKEIGISITAATPKVKYHEITRSISQESNTEDVEMTQYYSSVSKETVETESAGFEELKTDFIKDSGISITAKPLETATPSVSLYQTARSKSLSPKIIGPMPRKPILRLSVEPEPFSNRRIKTLEHKESISKNTFSDRAKEEGSSGLGTSINRVQSNVSKTGITSVLKITSITTLPSVEFKPQICSSKVGETQTKLLLEQQHKMSEQSTVVMTSDMELHEDEKSETKATFIQPRAPLASIRELEMDTTLGMSSYDIIDFDAPTAGSGNEEEIEEDGEGEGEGAEEKEEGESNSDLKLLETAEEIVTSESEDQESDETAEHYEENSQSSHVIELLSTTDENNSESNGNTIDTSYTDTEDTSNSEVTDNTNSNLASSNLETSTSDPIVELVEDGVESTISDSDKIVLPQETALSSTIVEVELATINVEQQNIPEILIEDYSELTTAAVAVVEVSIPGSEENLEKCIESTVNLEGIPEPQRDKTPDIIVEKYAIENIQMSIESTEASILVLPDFKVDEVVSKPVENEQVQLDESFENNKARSESKEDEQPSGSKMQIEESEKICSEKEKETSAIMSPIETTVDAENMQTDGKNKTSSADSSNIAETENVNIDTSDCFQTPNTSMQLVEALENDTSKNNHSANEAAHSDLLQAIDDNTNKYSHISRKRGQSVPPQALPIIEIENLEADSYTPRRRSKRGISVPPQTVETPTLLTPTKRKKATPRNTENKRKSVNEESPQSPTSSRSDHESQQKGGMLLGSSGTPILDSPALRTRSRMRTISETSNVTENSINSPSVSAKKSRRNSVSSNVSEQLQQHSLTPKRSRRQSISSLSDTDRIPLSKRVLLKDVDVDAEAQNQDANSPQKSTDAGMAIYSSTRRLTRTQKAILEKSEQISAAMESNKDDLLSSSIQPNQIVTRSQTARSVKSNDDGDDDRASIASSTASEARRTRRRLRTQHQNSPTTNLTAIPEDDVIGDADSNSKRNKIPKK